MSLFSLTTMQKDTEQSTFIRSWPISEVAELNKRKFFELVRQLAVLRDLQYEKDEAESIMRRAENVVL